jgi:hypothetical protein
MCSPSRWAWLWRRSSKGALDDGAFGPSSTTPPLVVVHRVRRVTGAKLLVALLVFGCGRRATQANGVEASLGRCVVGSVMVGGWCWCLVEAWTT